MDGKEMDFLGMLRDELQETEYDGYEDALDTEHYELLQVSIIVGELRETVAKCQDTYDWVGKRDEYLVHLETLTRLYKRLGHSIAKLNEVK